MLLNADRILSLSATVRAWPVLPSAPMEQSRHPLRHNGRVSGHLQQHARHLRQLVFVQGRQLCGSCVRLVRRRLHRSRSAACRLLLLHRLGRIGQIHHLLQELQRGSDAKIPR